MLADNLPCPRVRLGFLSIGCACRYKGAQPTLDESLRLPQFDDSAQPAHPPFTTDKAFVPDLDKLRD